jgi:hypothetical protein
MLPDTTEPLVLANYSIAVNTGDALDTANTHTFDKQLEDAHSLIQRQAHIV